MGVEAVRIVVIGLATVLIAVCVPLKIRAARRAGDQTDAKGEETSTEEAQVPEGPNEGGK